MLSRSSYQSCFVKRGTLKILQFLKFHSKTPVLESLFYEVAGLKMFSCEICEIFKSTFFIHPVAASIDLIIVVSWEQNEKKIFQPQNISVMLRQPKVLPEDLQLYWKRLQYKCFPVKVAKVLSAPFLKKICQRLLLAIILLNNFSITPNWSFTNNIHDFAKNRIKALFKKSYHNKALQ